MRPAATLAFLVLSVALAALPGAAADRSDGPHPYLTGADEPDEGAILPAPPAPGSEAEAADRQAFLTSRALEGTPRWRLAIADADRTPAAVWSAFSCALGAVVPVERVPVLIDLLGRLNDDVEQATAQIKTHYRRTRPLVGNDAPLCVPRTDRLRESYSYPSGHAMQGWATALLLAELAPGRATQLLRRGIVFGDSRAVCGVHWRSDVEASRTAAAVLVSVLHGNDAFRQDLDQARAELAAARSRGAAAPDPAACLVETEAANPVSAE